WPMLVNLGLLLLGLAYLACFRRCRHALFVALALLGLANATSEDGISRSAREGRLSRDAFGFIIEADRFTAELDPTLTDIRYCYDPNETVDVPRYGRVKMREVFCSYLATRLLFTDPLVEQPEAARLEHLGPAHPLDASVTQPERNVGWAWSIGPFHHL